MEAGESNTRSRNFGAAATKTNTEVVNGDLVFYSSSDSDSEYPRRNIFPLRSQRLPRDSLKFILTIWYSPETSSAIAESISTGCTDVQLKKLIAGSPRDILRLAAKYFGELDI
ncbi:unnamed protein product [Calicophoron daubneyi]|uniref:Uncharacterized protein n=1 Tax=Calicophoron daubneyi TaxID=300641 RepID=A0AAV2TLQ5_CALDB